jgi:hypothetical protein
MNDSNGDLLFSIKCSHLIRITRTGFLQDNKLLRDSTITGKYFDSAFVSATWFAQAFPDIAVIPDQPNATDIK